ncbi:MAG: polysaccharide biosynthesis C-terminal domain-containing protein [Dissulfurimicrobium hydrothermale]|uniref:oligosaccharide flippase family protein n=1 Tax=Dissulfurimicrobium hydrothermale TaxID=1750598 RepID=UPI003C773108
MSLRFLSAQWAATAYVGLVGLGLNFLLARLLGPGRFGDYGVALAGGAIACIFLDGGFKTLLMRERTLATGALAGLVPTLHAVAIGHAMGTAVVMGTLVFVFMPGHRDLAVAAVAYFLGIALIQFVSGALRGDGRFDADAGWQVGARTVSAVAILGVLLAGAKTPTEILLAGAAGSLVSIMFLPHGQARFPRLEWHPEAYRAAVFLLWIDLATVVYFRSDMLLLKVIGVPAWEIGQYAAAYRFIEAIILLATPISLLIFRKLRLEWQDLQRLRRRTWRALLLAAAAGVLAATLLSVFGEWVIALAYGKAYGEATSLLGVLACALLFILPNFILTQAAIALNHEHAYAVIATMAAALNIVLNSWLIPRYGVKGAAWVTVATEGWLFVGLSGFLLAQRRAVDKPHTDKVVVL